jgi:ABC-type polysaccharide/polyol phosphate transport system ATPase subunit
MTNGTPFIKAQNISKKFCKSLKNVMIYGSYDIISDFIGIAAKTDELRQGEFWAVDDVSFELKKGDIYGIIGPNGSGKSTILKMLNGIYMPDRGKIEIRGRVGALIEIGAGFHPMLTGRENVYINGAILGMSKKEIDAKYDQIVAFSDIGDFINAPVKHYSSGMYVRLGFSVAVHCEPDILLVDEVLAVGDAQFYNKCTNKINEIRNRGTTIVLVSHSMWLIQTMCDRVLLLGQGKTVKIDSPFNCIQEYANIQSIESQKSRHQGKQLPLTVEYADVRDGAGNPIRETMPDGALMVKAKYLCQTDLFHGFFFLRVTSADGYPLYTSYSELSTFNIGEGFVDAFIPSFSLLAGEYKIWIGICGEKKEEARISEKQLKLDVLSSSDYPDPRYGVFFNQVRWSRK